MDAATTALLDGYAAGLRGLFGDKLVGVYLTGSLALGDYHPGKSDIDASVVLREPVDEREFAALGALHKALRRQPGGRKLEAHYVTAAELGRGEGEVGEVAAWQDGRMRRSRFNLNPVTWLTLKWYGVVVAGLPVEELGIESGADELVAYVRGNVESYWMRWLAMASKPWRPRSWIALSDWAVEWCVAGMSRMLYTLREADITSKRGALEYMLERAPERHRRVLAEALRIRLGGTGAGGAGAGGAGAGGAGAGAGATGAGAGGGAAAGAGGAAARSTTAGTASAKSYRSPFERRRDMLAFMRWVGEEFNA